MKTEPINYNYCEDPRIRYSAFTYECPFDGWRTDLKFEIFKRPYLWGLLGRKRWETSIITNSFKIGHGFSASLLR